jgi:hypothetical protein
VLGLTSATVTVGLFRVREYQETAYWLPEWQTFSVSRRVSLSVAVELRDLGWEKYGDTILTKFVPIPLLAVLTPYNNHQLDRYDPSLDADNRPDAPMFA